GAGRAHEHGGVELHGAASATALERQPYDPLRRAPHPRESGGGVHGQAPCGAGADRTRRVGGRAPAHAAAADQARLISTLPRTIGSAGASPQAVRETALANII